MALLQPGFWACVPASMPPGSGYGFFIYGVKQPVLDVSVSPLSSHGPVSACVEPLLRRCILGWATSSFHATHLRPSFLITWDRQCASRFLPGCCSGRGHRVIAYLIRRRPSQIHLSLLGRRRFRKQHGTRSASPLATHPALTVPNALWCMRPAKALKAISAQAPYPTFFHSLPLRCFMSNRNKVENCFRTDTV